MQMQVLLWSGEAEGVCMDVHECAWVCGDNELLRRS